MFCEVWLSGTTCLWFLILLKCHFCFLNLKTAFFRQHGCSTNDTNAKYNSRAAQMYREKIRQLANAALSKYGTDVSINEGKTFRKCLLHCRCYYFCVGLRAPTPFTFKCLISF